MCIRFSTAAKVAFNSKSTIKINETDVLAQYHNDIQSERTPYLPWGLSLKWFFRKNDVVVHTQSHDEEVKKTKVANLLNFFSLQI